MSYSVNLTELFSMSSILYLLLFSEPQLSDSFSVLMISISLEISLYYWSNMKNEFHK